MCCWDYAYNLSVDMYMYWMSIHKNRGKARYRRKLERMKNRVNWESEKELFDLVRKNYAEANRDYIFNQNVKACEYCSQNTKNGGSGICNCILGNPILT